jgi:hypothetical protein
VGPPGPPGPVGPPGPGTPGAGLSEVLNVWSVNVDGVTIEIDGFNNLRVILATQADVDAGVNAVRAITPATLAAATTVVHPARTLTAGAGLTGGGDLSANRTFDVVANADGSIVVNANDVQVGVLATDAQHGVRGGGTQHAAATTVLQGFIEIATQAEVDAGVDATRAVTPATLAGTPRGGAILHWGNSGILPTTTTRFLTPGFAPSNAQTTAIQYRAPRAGTARNMFIQCTTAPGDGDPVVYTLRVNSVASALLVSLASNVLSGSDLINTVAIAQGDLIDIQVTKALNITTSPTDIVCSIEIV